MVASIVPAPPRRSTTTMVAPVRPPPPIYSGKVKILETLTNAEHEFYKDFLNEQGDMYNPLLVVKEKLKATLTAKLE